MKFIATLKVSLSNVIDETTFLELYHGNAKAMLLDTFVGPIDMALNADDVLLVHAEEDKE